MGERHGHQLPLGAALEAERERRNLSVETVAARAGVKEQWLLRVEAGDGNPTWGHLRRLAEAIGVPLPELMKRVEDHEEEDGESSASESRRAKKRGRRKRGRSKRRARKRVDNPREALAKALSHSVRAQALSLLTERTASPKEIADELDQKLTNVSYHVRVLEELGLIELVEEESIRGSVAHFYKALQQDVFRTPLLLDEDGWRRVVEIQGSAVKAILEEQASAKQRLAGSRSDGIKAVLGLLLFEAAPEE